MRRTAWVLGLLAIATPAAAQTASERPEVFRKLVGCRAIDDPQKRLACFDAQVGALAAAEEKKEVVIVDRAQVRTARRSLFGLSLPKLALFGDGEDEEVDREIVSTIRSASVRPNGRWAITLADGAKWVQTELKPLNRDARPGQTVRIRRAAMGSFLANIDGQIAIRMRREN